MALPQTTVLPHTTVCDHANVSPAIVEVGDTGPSSHHVPDGASGAMFAASRTAPSPFRPPAPCDSGSAFRSGSAVYSRIALMAFGGSGASCDWRFASIINATTPVVTAAAMLVPLRRK